MKAHPLPRGTQSGCLCDGTPAQYAVDFGGNRRFEICGACFNIIFGKPAPVALLRLSERSTTAAARDTFQSWLEHLCAVEAARRLGGTYT